MALRIDNNFGLFSGGSGGSGGGVSYVGAIGVNGINVTGSPILSCGTFGITNTAPYEGQAVVVLGSGTCSTLRCGVNNSASGNYSASLGGSFNCSSGTNSVVVGGIGNNASGDKSFIGGGCYNCTTGTDSVIGGGVCNFLKNTNGAIDVVGSVIGGGVGNNTSGGTWSGTSFSSQPTPSDSVCFTFIGGGFQNASKGCGSSIGGGLQNIAIGVGSTILGGNINCSVDNYTTIGGGQQNNSCGVGSTIVGGRVNTTKSTYNVILGGCANITDNTSSVVGGGAINCACTSNSFIGGGCKNSIVASLGCANTIGGGFLNRVCNSSNYSFIGGGGGNRTSDNIASVVSGIMNDVGSSVLLPISYTDFNTQIIYFVGDVTSQISTNNCVYYYHTRDCVVYSGGATSISYCSELGLTAVCGVQLCAGVRNSLSTYGRNATTETTSNSNFAQIYGGFSNTITNGTNGVIVNGVANLICQVSQSSISNGCANCIIAPTSSFGNSIKNGTSNTINVNGSYNAIINGCTNNMYGACISNALIGNGNANTIACCNSYGLILNGCSNILNGNFALIGNGICNNLYDVTNPNVAFASVIVNGVGNNTSGGTWNDTTKVWSVAPTRVAPSCYTFIGNGFQNQIVSPYSTITNGCCNIIGGSSIGTIIGSGLNNIICLANYSSIVGGSFNSVCCSTFSFIGNGSISQICESTYSVIGGGALNNVCSISDYSIIGGGCNNIIKSSVNSVIGGGFCNCIGLGLTLQSSAILGGCNNKIYSNYGTIGGGVENIITQNSDSSSILGGTKNSTNNFSNVNIIGSSINATRSNATFVNNLNISDTPTINNSVNTLGWDATSKQVVLKTLGVGVSSVGLVMPPAFSVLNSPITTSGSICVVGAGLTSQYIRGDGELATFPVVSGGGGGSVYYLNTTVDSTISGTSPSPFLKQMSRSAVFPTSTCVIDNSGVTDGSPFVTFITDVNQPNLTELPGGVWEYNAYLSVGSGTSSQVRADVWKYCSNDSTFYNISVGAPLTLADGDNVSLYAFSTAVPTTPLATDDRIAVYLVALNTTDIVCLTTSASRLAAVTTTFTSGIGSVNGLSASSQFFTQTTSGNDFNITSSCCTHCFNLPTASATKRGLLSCQDWGIFNNKQSSSFPANTFYANPTSSTATAIAATYCESGEQTLAFACISQIGTTCYSAGTQYIRYTKIGNLVNLFAFVCFGATTANNISGIELKLPNTIPTPAASTLIPTSLGQTITVASSMFSAAIGFGGGIVKSALTISGSSTSFYSICWILPSGQNNCKVYVSNVTYIANSI
jgi:hypothetical protein